MSIPKILTDKPEEVDENLWPGLAQFSTRIAETLEALPTSSPVLIAGDWGTGKTTLLLSVQRTIGESETNRPTIWFDAWRYENESNLLPALIRTIWDAAPAGFRNAEASKHVFSEALRWAAVVGVRAIPAVAGLLTGGVGAAAVAMTKGWSAKALGADRDAIGARADSNYGTDPARELWIAYKDLVATAWSGRSPIVLVDDLDRCNPDSAVALMDAIRILVVGAAPRGAALEDERGGCLFVTALDRGVMADAISRKFEGIGGYDGNRYLEKIFPLCFTVPTLGRSDVDRLLEQLLRTEDDLDAGGDLEHRDAVGRALRDPMFANPRLMKRCINRFRLILSFELDDVTASPSDPQSNRALAKWIAATERWPRLRALMARHGKEYWDLIAGFLESGSSLPGPEARELLNQPGAGTWLRTEVFDAAGPGWESLRQADGRLRRWGM